MFHKVHHEFQVTIAIAATYAHPFDITFLSFVPAVSGIILLGKKVHFITFAMWIYTYTA